jgi:hypothetical protein
MSEMPRVMREQCGETGVPLLGHLGANASADEGKIRSIIPFLSSIGLGEYDREM